MTSGSSSSAVDPYDECTVCKKQVHNSLLTPRDLERTTRTVTCVMCRNSQHADTAMRRRSLDGLSVKAVRLLEKGFVLLWIEDRVERLDMPLVWKPRILQALTSCTAWTQPPKPHPSQHNKYVVPTRKSGQGARERLKKRNALRAKEPPTQESRIGSHELATDAGPSNPKPNPEPNPEPNPGIEKGVDKTKNGKGKGRVYEMDEGEIFGRERPEEGVETIGPLPNSLVPPPSQVPPTTAPLGPRMKMGELNILRQKASDLFDLCDTNHVEDAHPMADVNLPFSLYSEMRNAFEKVKQHLDDYTHHQNALQALGNTQGAGDRSAEPRPSSRSLPVPAAAGNIAGSSLQEPIKVEDDVTNLNDSDEAMDDD